MTGHRAAHGTASVHEGPAGAGVFEVLLQHGLHGAEGAVGGGGTGVHWTADCRQHMGGERRQTLHVLQAGVEIAAGDHGAAERLQQLGGHADQFILDRLGLCGPSDDLAAGETGAVKIVLVGHQPRQPLSVGDAGLIAWVIEQAQASVGGALGIGVLRHHEHREVIGDVFRQHRHRRRCFHVTAHQATFSIIWWCST